MVRLSPRAMARAKAIAARLGITYGQVLEAGLEALEFSQDPASMITVADLTITLSELGSEVEKLHHDFEEANRMMIELMAAEMTPPVHANAS